MGRGHQPPSFLFVSPAGSSCLQIREHARLLLDEFDLADHHEANQLEALSKHPARLTAEERLIVLHHVHFEADWISITEILTVDNIETSLFHARGLHGTTLLHMLATFSTQVTDESRRLVWSNIVQQAVRAGADFNALDLFANTPFTALLRLEARPDRLDKAIFSWLTCLAHAGIDLGKYGSVEQDHWRKLGNDSHCQKLRNEWTVLGFNYGSKPSDWRLWWRYAGDPLVGIFWALVEDPEPAMPGSWVDDNIPSIDWLAWSLRKGFRYSGIKRKCLRRLQSELKRSMQNGTYGPDTIGLFDELTDLVKLNAESWKISGFRSDNYYRLREVASLLGIL